VVRCHVGETAPRSAPNSSWKHLTLVPVPFLEHLAPWPTWGAKLGAIPCGRLWTPVDGAWRSTDQKVGGRTQRVRRVPPGVLLDPPVFAGGSCHLPPKSMPWERSLGRVWAARFRARMSSSRLMRVSTSEGIPRQAHSPHRTQTRMTQRSDSRRAREPARSL